MSGEKEWIITISQEIEKELVESFELGPIIRGDLRQLDEQLVEYLNGLKIEIFANEHPPPHFRVNYAGETANYTIDDCHQLNGGLSKWYKNIKKWHKKNKQNLIQTWNSTRPSNCPVGKYKVDNE